MSSSSAFARPSDPRSAFWSSDAGDIHPVTLPHLPVDFGRRPRLPSPRLFPRDFPTLPAPNASTRTQSFRQPDHFRDPVIDINRALESANTAIQDAQEAFVLPELRDTREHNSPMPPFVDLTDTSPSQSPELYRHDARSPRRHTNTMALLNDLPPDYHPNTRVLPALRVGAHTLPQLRAGFAEYNADSQSRPARRRQRSDQQTQRQIFEEPFSLFSGRPRPDMQEREQQAIQRQREARALWESNQTRREALIQRRSRSRSRSPRRLSPPLRQRSEGDGRPPSSGSQARSELSVESIDLTAVDEKTAASDILAKQREDAVASQKPSTESGRTRLTSYKCPICMEVPTDVTSTVCGHIFCHRCIWETLKWSEEQRAENMPHGRAKGVCPVCRKELKRIDMDERGRTLVPMRLQLGDQIRRRPKEDVKGKGVARGEPVRESSSDWLGSIVNLEGT